MYVNSSTTHRKHPIVRLSIKNWSESMKIDKKFFPNENKINIKKLLSAVKSPDNEIQTNKGKIF